MKSRRSRLPTISSTAAALLVAAAVAHPPPEVEARSPQDGTRIPQIDLWDPEKTWRDQWMPERMDPAMRQRMMRHWSFMHEGPPEAYRGARNPLSSTDETVAAGRTLYRQACAVCHGTAGLGDGEDSLALTPSPALLAHLIQVPATVDPYLFWTVSEGGGAFGTDMPAFKHSLSETEIWQIITFMRAGFPPEEP